VTAEDLRIVGYFLMAMFALGAMFHSRITETKL
jgi:hypothetical protein